MIDKFKEEQQRYAIDAASMIKGEIYSETCYMPFKDAFSMDKSVLKISFKPQRYTLLHDYISYRLKEDYYHCLKKMGSDIYEEVYSEFKSNNISFTRHEQYRGTDYRRYLYSQYCRKINSNKVWNTFTILFRDRSTMKQFNINISEEIQNLKKFDYPLFLSRDGVMKRNTFWPIWLRYALLRRESGSCAICLRDLTGIISSNLEVAVDHLVPLNLGGINDPTNLQLLCKNCNTEKGGDKLTSSDMYPPFWMP